MWMTDEEIASSYREAKNKPEQIKILAEINLTKDSEIVQKLHELGFQDVEIKQFKKGRRGGKQTFDEEKARALYFAGASDQEMADALGVARSTICSWRTNRGFGSNAHQKAIIRMDTKQALALYLEGKNDVEMSKALGVSRDAVRYWRIKHGLEPNRRHRKHGKLKEAK